MSQSDSQPRFRPVIILPTYNNARTLMQVLEKLDALKLPLIIINDGATDETADILTKWQQTNADPENRIIDHERNMGKGAALETGFEAAIAAAYSHAVTMDSDGQLDPDEIPNLLTVASRHPEAFILGVRDSHRPDYPVSSRIGRSLSNFMVRLECGQQVEDSQCGFRIYPLARIRSLPVKADRFGYETEIITRAAWAGFPFREVPVTCRYFTDGSRVTHFRLYRDTARHIGMHLRLMMLSPVKRSRFQTQKTKKTLTLRRKGPE